MRDMKDRRQRSSGGGARVAALRWSDGRWDVECHITFAGQVGDSMVRQLRLWPWIAYGHQNWPDCRHVAQTQHQRMEVAMGQLCPQIVILAGHGSQTNLEG